MLNKREKIASLICSSDSALNYRGWLAQEAGDLALKITYLDEIPPWAILPLAQMAAHGESDAEKLAWATGIDETKLQEYLEALCEFKFAEETWNGYKATTSGEQAFDAVGNKMVIRERYELKRRLEQLEDLYRQLGDL